MRPSSKFNPPHRLSMRLEDGQGPSRVSSRLNDGLTTDKQSFLNLKERSDIQKEREMNVDTDNTQFEKILNYGVRRDHNEWSRPRNPRDVKISKEKLNCSPNIPANFSSNLFVNLFKDLNQWRLKDQLPDEKKYVIFNQNLNALIKALFGVVTAFPNDPNPLFSSHFNSQESKTSSCNNSFCSETKFKSSTTETVSTTTQTEPESSNLQADNQLTKSLWETEFAIAAFEQQNKNLLTELSNLKVSLNCAIRSRANATFNADRAESKLEISERMTSDLFEGNKEVKKQLEEATSKVGSLQSKLLEANKTNILSGQKLDENDLANKRLQESLTKKTNQIKNQSEVEKLIKQLLFMRVEIDIQRAEAIQLIQAVDRKQYEKLEKSLHALLIHANHWDWKDYERYSVFNVKRGNIKSRLPTIYYPIAYDFDKNPNWKEKCTHLPWPINPKTSPLEKIIEVQEENNRNRLNP